MDVEKQILLVYARQALTTAIARCDRYNAALPGTLSLNEIEDARLACARAERDVALLEAGFYPPN